MKVRFSYLQMLTFSSDYDRNPPYPSLYASELPLPQVDYDRLALAT